MTLFCDEDIYQDISVNRVGRAMVLGNFQCWGVLLICIILGLVPTVLPAGAGGVDFDFSFLSSSFFSHLSLSLSLSLSLDFNAM